MKPDDLRSLLSDVAAGKLGVEDAERRLAMLPFESLGFAHVDHHRALRTGTPEVVFGPGKTADQIADIIVSMRKAGHSALVTRVDRPVAPKVRGFLPLEMGDEASYDPVSRLFFVGPKAEERGRGVIGVVAAGTSDGPVAEEAAQTAELFGNRVARITDVGVAGLHRLLAHRETLESCEVLIVIAGMEGALPSVLAGLVSRPVIAVPTSIGVGASFGGLAALLAMLNSCAPGVTVVNIDNGFGAAVAASTINRRREARST
ncbi:MAG: nickel pincer cofactor biosynthesis protein LarB [Deltaproteobacteria bacterium]|nr:nickel pincer cofactor biosynthesis protein LarB [Deltaproteobacteria bacterium]